MIKKFVMKIYLPDGKEGFTFQKDNENWLIEHHDLIKNTSSKYRFTGKAGFTKSGKAGFTKVVKRGLHTKENTKEKRNIVVNDNNLQKSKNGIQGDKPKVKDLPFSLSREIKKLEDDERREMNVIALYLEHRKPDLQTYEQYQETLKRHIKPAKSLSKFTDQQIIKSLNYAKKEYPEIYTLETLLKILTK